MIKVKRILPNAIIPKRATSNSVGYDLTSCVHADIFPGDVVSIRTGLALEIPPGLAGLIFPRSGLGMKGIVLSNLTGVIDSDYRGEIIVSLWNRNDEGPAYKILDKDRVAQILFVPVWQEDLVEAELSKTERGDNGFGSTGRS